MQKPLAIFLMGPTASGKTDLAIALHQALPVEIISVDSALIYQGMDIGTAKPTPQELALVPHRLIDIKDPAESYSVADFCHDALKEMQTITQQGKIPLLVGGTMMYYKNLLDGLSPLPPASPSLRAKIEQDAQQQGWQALHHQLAKIDPLSAKRINPNDSQRINRALEVFYLTGKTLSSLNQQKGQPLPYQIQQFALAPPERSILHQRIEQRFHHMLEQGFQQEVEKLYQRGDLSADLPAIRSVGYRQMWAYLQGESTYEEMVFRGICATRQLAKRQITWLRGWTSTLHWLDSTKPKQAFDQVIRIIPSLR